MSEYKLPDNHKRALSSTLMLIYKLLSEIEYQLLHHHDNAFKIIDIEDINIKETIQKINDIKPILLQFKQKYQIEEEITSINQFIQARKSKMWEVLCDTKSNKLKGRGEFPKDIANEFDHDIEKLLSLIETI